ncbi:uncharacterized protein ACLA_019720 [Aspergillus clavatus NRRL 1]|uniref:Uncharacterized protein n=1 Tax=Aspergillus clavatus (strain ATCC 1007 / CBS 513.65 / DSM 816 / NCTC 3887 / NRRL 1 / QM 1276 / 107) TaxID=344612 RepID=A1CNP6_ASPCL|nr:uncharacterized protein ACLA_019720 [Aspergillus clavatus NRRL 1]EAW07267.1 conserved hypothetical protein [Aspergillus clavatus NRRL 1]
MKSGPATTKLKGKASTPNLREKNGISTAANTSQHQPLKKRSVPNLRSRASAPNMRKRGTPTSFLEDKMSSKTPFLTTQTPKKQKVTSTAQQEVEVTPGGPRFMMFNQAQAIKPVDYQPKPQYTGPAVPRIMGCEPTITRRKPIEVKRESRKERILKALKKRHEFRKARLRGVMKCFKNLRMIRTMHLSVKAMRLNTQDRLLEMESIVSLDYRRYSEMSAYSDRGNDLESSEVKSSDSLHCPGIEGTPTSLSVKEDEDHTVRRSLLPFRAWLPLMQDNSNPYLEASDEDAYTRAPANSPSFPQDSSTHSFFHSLPTPQTHSSPKSLDDISPRSSLSSSSDITITPLRIYKKSVMALESGLEAQDPFVDSPTLENRNTSDEGDNIQHAPSKAKPTSTLQTTVRGRGDHNTRIPRPPVQKLSLGGNQVRGCVSPERSSSIPVALRKVSKDKPSTPEGGSGEVPVKSIRVVEKAAASHETPPQPEAKAQQEHGFDQIHQVFVEELLTSPASSNTSSSDTEWKAQVLERPTGFTGDDRRPNERSSQRFYGPRLHIAASAEEIIMGPESRSVAPHLSSPHLVRIVSRTVTESDAHEEPAEDQFFQQEAGFVEKKIDHDTSTGSPVASRKSCRPQPSFESMPKRDFSSRELSIPRKPVGSPSSSSIFSSSPDKESKVPIVPKIPDEHKVSLNKDKPLPELKSNEVMSSGNTDASTQRVAATVDDSSHPLRVLSMHAICGAPAQEGPSAPIPVTPNELNKNATFDEIIIKSAEAEHLEPRGTTSKIPESKSNRMLDSFRSIFKHKGSIDRGRLRNYDGVEVATEGAAAKALSGTASRSKKDDSKSDSVRPGSKLRTKYSKLPDSVSWSRGPRNISAPIHVSPGAFPTPTSSLSIPAPSFRSHEVDQTPSFARPTKSTRTRAATNPKVQTPVGSTDGRTRRISTMAASTGSPQRSHRFPRYASASSASRKADQMTLATQKQPETSMMSKDTPVQEAQSQEDPDHALSRRHEEVNTFIGVLCQKLCLETEENRRTRYLRYLLSLQQSLNEVKNARREVDEAEAMLRKKKSQRTAAESSLFEKYRVALNRIDTIE